MLKMTSPPLRLTPHSVHIKTPVPRLPFLVAWTAQTKQEPPARRMTAHVPQTDIKPVSTQQPTPSATEKHGPEPRYSCRIQEFSTGSIIDQRPSCTRPEQQCRYRRGARRILPGRLPPSVHRRLVQRQIRGLEQDWIRRLLHGLAGTGPEKSVSLPLSLPRSSG